MTLTDQQFLNGAKDGPEVIIGGELRLPRLANERLPAVVLLHGTSGIAAYVSGNLHQCGNMLVRLSALRRQERPQA